VAKVAAASAVSTRRGPGYVIPRTYRGRPADLDTNRCYHSIPRWLCAKPIVRFKTRIEELLRGPEDDRAIDHDAGQLNRLRGRSPFHRFGTKNTSFIEAMRYHGMLYKPDVERIEETRAIFVDGTSFECDVIICCTGYVPSFPFLSRHEPELDEACRNVRRLYKHMILPRLGADLAWIGFVRPGVGSIPPCAEMQARYYAQLLSGKLRLPEPLEMQKDIEHHERLDFEQYPEDAPRISALTDYLRFLEGMAEVIGCKPPLWRMLISNPRSFAGTLFGPITGIQYRFTGPGATPDAAHDVVGRIPMMPWPVLAYEFLILISSMAMHRLGMDEKYAPLGV
jgi:dimethylaniline monooxygenase (N-oxide forming)